MSASTTALIIVAVPVVIYWWLEWRRRQDHRSDVLWLAESRGLDRAIARSMPTEAILAWIQYDVRRPRFRRFDDKGRARPIDE